MSYNPTPIDTADVELGKGLEELVELLDERLGTAPASETRVVRERLLASEEVV